MKVLGKLLSSLSALVSSSVKLEGKQKQNQKQKTLPQRAVTEIKENNFM